jgi:hypothetical protein
MLALPKGNTMSDTTTPHATSGRSWGYVGAVLGGLVSIAANVAHSYVPPARASADWRPAIGDVVGAVFWPVALFVAIEILARTGWPSGKRWVVVRFLGLLPVAVVAAIVSYGHLSGLLAHYGESALTSHLGPLAVDGLMVMASSALMATAPRRTPDTTGQTKPVVADTTPDTIADSTPDTTADAAPVVKPKRARTTSTKPARTSTAGKVVALAAKHPDMTTVEMAKKLGVTDRTIRRHLNTPTPDPTAAPISAEPLAPVLATSAA